MRTAPTHRQLPSLARELGEALERQLTLRGLGGEFDVDDVEVLGVLVVADVVLKAGAGAAAAELLSVEAQASFADGGSTLEGEAAGRRGGETAGGGSFSGCTGSHFSQRSPAGPSVDFIVQGQEVSLRLHEHEHLLQAAMHAAGYGHAPSAQWEVRDSTGELVPPGRLWTDVLQPIYVNPPAGAGG